MTDREIIMEVKNIIRRHLPEKEFKIFLFGSIAKSKASKNSDIDIGILGRKKINLLLLHRIKEEIKGIPTLKKVDVVELSNSACNFTKKVLKHAKKI